MRQSHRSFFAAAHLPQSRSSLSGILCAGLICFGLTACSPARDFSQKSDEWDANSEWPSLLPTQNLNALISEQNTTNAEVIAAQASLAQRAAALQNRAEALRRRGILSAAERRELLAALAR